MGIESGSYATLKMDMRILYRHFARLREIPALRDAGIVLTVESNSARMAEVIHDAMEVMGLTNFMSMSSTVDSGETIYSSGAVGMWTSKQTKMQMTFWMQGVIERRRMVFAREGVTVTENETFSSQRNKFVRQAKNWSRVDTKTSNRIGEEKIVSEYTGKHIGNDDIMSAVLMKQLSRKRYIRNEQVLLDPRNQYCRLTRRISIRELREKALAREQG